MESGVNNVWIDYNILEVSGGELLGYDFLLDMKVGVINVMVFYNWYWDFSWVGLVGFSDLDSVNINIIFYYNWYQNIEQCILLICYGLVYIYNNYWLNLLQNYMFYVINFCMGVWVLVEGNYFYNVNNFLLVFDDLSEFGCWQIGENIVEFEIYYSCKVGDGVLDVFEIVGG